MNNEPGETYQSPAKEKRRTLPKFSVLGDSPITTICMLVGSILFILGMILTPAHDSASAAYDKDLEKWEDENPNVWDKLENLPPIPSWFVLSGEDLGYFVLWIGVLLLLWAIYMRCGF